MKQSYHFHPEVDNFPIQVYLIPQQFANEYNLLLIKKKKTTQHTSYPFVVPFNVHKTR